MIEKAKGQYVLLEPEELPTISAIKDSIMRLRKDADLISRLSTKKDANPQGLRKTADFLEHLILAYKKQFPKGDKIDDDTSDDSGSGRNSSSESASSPWLIC